MVEIKSEKKEEVSEILIQIFKKNFHNLGYCRFN